MIMKMEKEMKKNVIYIKKYKIKHNPIKFNISVQIDVLMKIKYLVMDNVQIHVKIKNIFKMEFVYQNVLVNMHILLI